MLRWLVRSHVLASEEENEISKAIKNEIRAKKLAKMQNSFPKWEKDILTFFWRKIFKNDQFGSNFQKIDLTFDPLGALSK